MNISEFSVNSEMNHTTVRISGTLFSFIENKLIHCPRLIISSRSLAMRLARSMTESVVGRRVGAVAAVFQRVTNTHSAFL